MAVVSTDVGDVRLKDGILLIEDVSQLRTAIKFNLPAASTTFRNVLFKFISFSVQQPQSPSRANSPYQENSYLQLLREHLKQWMPEQSTKKVIFNVHLTRELDCKIESANDLIKFSIIFAHFPFLVCTQNISMF